MSSGYRLSIIANIVLISLSAVQFWLYHRQSEPLASRATFQAAAQHEAATTKALPKTPLSNASGKITSVAVAQLRQLGVSQETIANVVIEDLNRRSTQRLASLQRRYAPKAVPDRVMLEFSRQCEAERIRELKDSLGEEGYRAWDKEQTLRELNSARAPGDELPLSPEEAEKAYRLEKEFAQKAQELQMAMEDGVADNADVDALRAQAQATLDRELEKLLGKQRFDELRGIKDPTTDVYRNFGDINPTPDQARAVVAAEADYRNREADLANRLHATPRDASSTAAELKAMSDAREADLRRIFGAEAYAATKRNNDPTYKTLKQYAEAWELKDAEIEPVYETVNAFLDRADTMRNAAEMDQAAGQHVNWREIDSAIEDARQQTESAVKGLIGAERLRRLKQNGVLSNR